MHALLGRSINSPIVIPDDDDELMKPMRSAGSGLLAKPQGASVTMPAGVASLQNGMGVMGLYPKAPVDPGVRLLRRIEVGQSSSAMWQQMTGGGKPRITHCLVSPAHTGFKIQKCTVLAILLAAMVTATL